MRNIVLLLRPYAYRFQITYLLLKLQAYRKPFLPFGAMCLIADTYKKAKYY